jgi:hypothetical protein
MTEDKIVFRELLEKGSDATFLREMIGFAAQRLMELETEGVCGAGYGGRSVDRRNQRNGELVKAMGMEGISKSQSLPRRKPGSRGSAARSTTASRRSSTLRSRANGPISGSTRPTSTPGATIASSRSRSSSPLLPSRRCQMHSLGRAG